MDPKNKRLDRLAWRKDKKVAFDIDGTLISGTVPRYDVIALLLWFAEKGYNLIAWSGGGVEYCQRWVEKLGLEDKVRIIAKGSEEVDIAFDDQPVTLGKVNIEV